MSPLRTAPQSLLLVSPSRAAWKLLVGAMLFRWACLTCRKSITEKNTRHFLDLWALEVLGTCNIRQKDIVWVQSLESSRACLDKAMTCGARNELQFLSYGYNYGQPCHNKEK